MARLAYNATLVSRIDLRPSLALFRVRPDVESGHDLTPNWFRPGQYVTLGINCDEFEGEAHGADSVRRPMSISSSPQDTDGVEFLIRRVDHPTSDFPFTHALFDVPIGGRLYMRRAPTGKFTFTDTVGDDDSRMKVMIAAGTGVAPFVAMIRQAAATSDTSLRDFVLLQGSSYPDGLAFRDELEQLVVTRGLRYLPTISRPHEVPDWTGATGRVEHLLAPDRIEATEAMVGLEPGHLHPSLAVVFVCGLQGTLASTITALLERGFTPDHRRLRRALEIPSAIPSTLFWEQYDAAPVLDVKDAQLMASLSERFVKGTARAVPGRSEEEEHLP